jgi:hypothetical protein
MRRRLEQPPASGGHAVFQEFAGFVGDDVIELRSADGVFG